MKTITIPMSTSIPMSNISKKDLVLRIIPILGSILVIAGTFLPWFSFFAGLHTYPGTHGLNGRILLAGGIISLLLSLFNIKYANNNIRIFVGVMGVLLLGFSGWILVGLFQVSRNLASDPMTLMQPGPGLFVVTIGAVLISVSMFLKQKNNLTSSQK